MRRIVLDTNVLVAGLRSRRGASNKLLNLIARGFFATVVSGPLVFEYEEVTRRHIDPIPYSADEVKEIIDFICAHSEARPVYYLWRPFLRDLNDDHVLEVAVVGQCDTIVTFNLRDFVGVDQFGIRAITPSSFLKEIEV